MTKPAGDSYAADRYTANDILEEEEEDCFYESFDRITSSPATTSCCSSPPSVCSDTEEYNNRIYFSKSSPNDSVFPVPKFPSMGASSKYDIWISEPSSIEERRMRLLREMGLGKDPSLSRIKPTFCDFNGDFTLSSVSVSSDQLNTQQRHETDVCCRSILSIHSSLVKSKVAHVNNNSSNSNISNHNLNRNRNHFVDGNARNGEIKGSRLSNVAPVAPVALPNKPPTGKNGKRVDEAVHTDAICSCANTNADCKEVDEDSRCDDGVVVADEQMCTIKNLDTGKEFVVDEIREDGMWNRLKEVGTGKQLTMEEFEMCVGHSPIVQELMRRQNVEDGNKDNLESNGNVGNENGNGTKSKKKGSSWFKSIKIAASNVASPRERRSSDEKDTSSEKGGRRSSSATDDSQDISFHGPERVRVRQYGKSQKELTALYKSQEIQAHNGSVWCIKFSLDGRYLASAGEDCVIHIWKVVESERKGDLLMEKSEDGHFNILFMSNGSPEPTSVSPNVDNGLEKKRRVRSSLSRKSISLEPIVVPETVFGLSEKPFCSFHGHLDDVLDLSWSKSQHLLSSSMDKTVRLWHLSSKSCLKIFSHGDYVTCIQFNPVDDRYFISGSLDAKVRIWSIPDRHVVDWYDLHEMVTAACYTPDGQAALVGSYKGSCRLFNTSDNKLQQKSQINLQNKKKKSHHKKITGFQFAPQSSSEVLVTSADSRVRVVDGVDLVHKFKGFRNTNSQISSSFSANGKYVVSASEDSNVYVWKHEGDTRPSRSKSVTVTRSYEHFHCQDVSAAIPWPGLSNICEPQDECTSSDKQNGRSSSSGNHYEDAVENSPSAPYFMDRMSSTWPEEKLLLATKNHSPRVSIDFSNGVTHNRSVWGMVIVTAGLQGKIRTFQNFGLPVRI